MSETDGAASDRHSFVLFSDSDEETKQRNARRIKRRNRIKGGARASGISQSEAESQVEANEPDEPDDKPFVDETLYRTIDESRLSDIPLNTKIMYVKKSDGKMISSKFFKRIDLIEGTITVGFYRSDDRNYDYKLDRIREILVDKSVKIGAAEIEEERLKNTIELKPSEWKNIAEGTMISYRKKDGGGMVFKVQFLKYVKIKKDNSTRMCLSLSNNKSYLANPEKIETIYRHVSNNDKILATMMKQLMILDKRIARLEAKAHK